MLVLMKLIMKMLISIVVLLLSLITWICSGVIYLAGLVLGAISSVLTLLGCAVLVAYSPKNGVILLIIGFLLSPLGLPSIALWLLSKLQIVKYLLQEQLF